jgi:formyl-CoA transferase
MTRSPVSGGPLDGLKVLELGQLIAGPFAAKTLADFGADVIKIEPPAAGDPLRKWRLLKDGTSVWWQVQSRNKRSVALDLKQAAAQDIVRQLAADADVMIENFRPGAMEGWGLAPDDLIALNPRLIVLRISGYGQTGPYRDRPGFGVVAEAMGGLRHLTAEPGRVPVRVGVSLGDTLAALHGVIGILLALQHRRASVTPETPLGKGQVIDVALYEAVFNCMESLLPEYSAFGAVRGPAGSALPGIAPSNAYRCKDDSEAPASAGPPQASPAPSGGRALREANEHGGFVAAGQPQARPAPSEGSESHGVGSVGAEGRSAGPPQARPAPLGCRALREANERGGFDAAGPPQARPAPPGGSEPHGVGSVGAYVLIAGNGDSIFKRLMAVIGRPDLAADPALSDNAGRVARVAEIDDAIGQWTARHAVDEVLAALEKAGVPAGRIYTVADIAADPHYRARGMLERVQLEDGSRLTVPGIVPKLSATPGRHHRNAPALGQDTDAVLEEIGLSAAQIQALKDRGIVAGTAERVAA